MKELNFTVNSSLPSTKNLFSCQAPSTLTKVHAENSSHLAEIVRNTTIEPDEVLVSFDVKSLFTSVPMKEAVECVKRIIQADASWELQSPIPISTIIKLLTICLVGHNVQVPRRILPNDGQSCHGIARLSCGSQFLHGRLGAQGHHHHDRSSTTWLRFVNDTLAIVKRYALQATLDHLNQQNPASQLTMEVEKDGKLPFLDVEIERKGAHLSMTVYRKPKHSGR